MGIHFEVKKVFDVRKKDAQRKTREVTKTGNTHSKTLCWKHNRGWTSLNTMQPASVVPIKASNQIVRRKHLKASRSSFSHRSRHIRERINKYLSQYWTHTHLLSIFVRMKKDEEEEQKRIWFLLRGHKWKEFLSLLSDRYSGRTLPGFRF